MYKKLGSQEPEPTPGKKIPETLDPASQKVGTDLKSNKSNVDNWVFDAL